MSARSRGEEDAHAFELLASVALSQEAEVANAVEAVWKRVQQKATDELVRLQAQDAGTTAAAISAGKSKRQTFTAKAVANYGRDCALPGFARALAACAG